MKVTYEHKPTMTFIGYSTSIRPEELPGHAGTGHLRILHLTGCIPI